MVATGGGGYEAFSATPRMWACAMAVLLGVEPPAELPAEWLALSAQAAELHGVSPNAARGTFDEVEAFERELSAEETLRLAEYAIQQTVDYSPLLAGRVR